MAKFKVGDIVKVRNDGFRYGSYFRFFERNGAPYEVAARFQHNSTVGAEYFNSKLFEVVFIGKHEDEDTTICAISEQKHPDFAPVYLFGEKGLELCEKRSYRVDVEATFCVHVESYDHEGAIDAANRLVRDSIGGTVLMSELIEVLPLDVEEVEDDE